MRKGKLQSASQSKTPAGREIALRCYRKRPMSKSCCRDSVVEVAGKGLHKTDCRLTDQERPRHLGIASHLPAIYSPSSGHLGKHSRDTSVTASTNLTSLTSLKKTVPHACAHVVKGKSIVHGVTSSLSAFSVVRMQLRR
jgi:hypothetical protein